MWAHCLLPIPAVPRCSTWRLQHLCSLCNQLRQFRIRFIFPNRALYDNAILKLYHTTMCFVPESCCLPFFARPFFGASSCCFTLQFVLSVLRADFGIRETPFLQVQPFSSLVFHFVLFFYFLTLASECVCCFAGPMSS